MGACDDCGEVCYSHSHKWQHKIQLPRRLRVKRHVVVLAILCLVGWHTVYNRGHLGLFDGRTTLASALEDNTGVPKRRIGESRSDRRHEAPLDPDSGQDVLPERQEASVEYRNEQAIILNHQAAQRNAHQDQDEDENFTPKKAEDAEGQDRPVEGGLVIGKEHSSDLEQEQSKESVQHLSLESAAELLPDFVYVPFEEAVKDEQLAGWEDRWFSAGIYDATTFGKLPEPMIDFIYLWVNGSDDAFQQTKLPWEERSVLNDPEGVWMASHGTNRYRDWDELRYSLRSIDRNAGHFRNNIQVLVNSLDQAHSSRGSVVRQTPTWLAEQPEHKIQVLAQEDFFNETTIACLPTFNSLTIENQLFNVPSDTDHFFAMSDDMLLGARHSPSDIYSPLFGSVMGFKTNAYSTVAPPTEQDAQRFGEKPYLIYTSWLLNRRFGIRKRRGQGHFGHSISRSIMREAITSFPRPELRSACKRFRGEPGFQLYSWYVTFHYLIERHREALLWSYLVLRSDADADGTLSWSERQTIISDLSRGTQNLAKTSFRRRNFYHVGAALEKAGLAPPQVNTNIQWTSLDGPVSMRDAGDCADFNIDDCLGPGFGTSRSSAGNPLFSAAVIFDRTARQNPHCGDCLLKIVLHQVRQGLAPLMPHADSQPRQRELVVKALARYKYSIVDPGNSLFVMVTDADQVDSTLVRRFVREGKELPGQLCLNDDVSTTDPEELDDTREAITELLRGLFPDKAAWEK